MEVCLSSGLRVLFSEKGGRRQPFFNLVYI